MSAAVAHEAPKSAAVVAPAGRLKGKVALVTGGTRGVGFSVAKAYVREGAKVAIAARTAREIKDSLRLLKEMGGDTAGIQIDLNSWSSCESLYNGVVRTFGKIDILVNNAGAFGVRQPVVNMPVDEWENVVRTNLNAVFWMTKAALGSMIPLNGGSIINVVSSVGLKGAAKLAAYSASKAGVINFTQAVADEVKPYNIRVNCVNPGATRSMIGEAATGLKPELLPSPDDIMNPFLYLASDASKGASGLYLDAADWVGRSF